MDTSKMTGFAEGVNKGIQNYYTLKSMKQGLAQKDESFKTDQKIKKLELTKLENTMSPELVKQQQETLKLQGSIQANQLKLYNTQLDKAMSLQEQEVKDKKTYLSGGTDAMQSIQGLMSAYKDGQVDMGVVAQSQGKQAIDKYLEGKDLNDLTPSQATQVRRMAGTNKALQGYVDNIVPEKSATDNNPYGLSASDRIAVKELSVKKFGKRHGTKRENLDLFEQQIAEGKTIDDIEDEQRLKLQSAGFKDEARYAIENIMGIKYTEARKQGALDTYDNMVQNLGEGKANDYLKKISRQEMDVESRKSVKGLERTVDFLGEIKDDLKAFAEKGGKTGLLTGNYEKVLNRLGRTQDPELKKIATKIKTKLIKFRKDNTGTAFSEQESREYKSIFPDIDSVNLVNMANIEALGETFTGDVDKLYTQAMGDFYMTNIKGEIPSEQGQSQEGQQGQETQASYEEGATATNPTTGEKLVLKNGQWVSAGGV